MHHFAVSLCWDGENGEEPGADSKNFVNWFVIIVLILEVRSMSTSFLIHLEHSRMLI